MQRLFHNSSLLRLTSLAVFVLFLTGYGVNNIPTYDEEVKAGWSQVLNQY
jgi:LemA protein